jgi:hypothetical protein
MNHQEAVRESAVEKYLLDELPAPQRDEFEEHFFECQECATDLRVTAAFLDEAKRQFEPGLAAQPAGAAARRPAPKAARKPRFAFLWRPAFAAPAFACLLLVIVYQNAALHPRLAGAAAGLDQPEVLTAVSLIGGNSRGGTIPAVTVTAHQPVLLSVDIPAAEPYASYSCTLVAPNGAIRWRMPVSAEQAKDTVTIRLPPGRWDAGDYTLLVQGYTTTKQGGPAEVARYRFAMNAVN